MRQITKLSSKRVVCSNALNGLYASPSMIKSLLGEEEMVLFTCQINEATEQK